MKTRVYSHRNGIDVLPEDIFKGIIEILEDYHPVIKRNCAKTLKKGLFEPLTKKGWSGEYRLDTESMISIASYYKGAGLNIQTGNAARIYADLLKLQTLFVKEKITCGIIIVPISRTAKEMGYCLASYERLCRELPIFNQVITMPIVVIGFEGD